MGLLGEIIDFFKTSSPDRLTLPLDITPLKMKN